MYNNQTFSTFGPENDAHHDLKYKDKSEDRIRPARGIKNQAAHQDIYNKLYNSMEKDEVLANLDALIDKANYSSLNPK